MLTSHAQISERIRFFGDLIACHTRYYLWTYDEAGRLLETNCTDPVLETVFKHSGCYQYMLDAADTARYPVFLSAESGLLWGAAFERTEMSFAETPDASDEISSENEDIPSRLHRIYVLGPVFTSQQSTADLRRLLSDADMTLHYKPTLISILQRVPVITYTTFLQQLVMLHYCITGERVDNSVIEYQHSPSSEEARLSPEAGEDAPRTNRMKLYMAEKTMLQMIRDGNLQYQDVLYKTSNASSTSSQNITGSPLLKAKIARIVFITLCSRAAMEGGVSPEMAYTRSDAYIQDIMNANTITDVSNIAKTGYDDFVHLVHALHKSPGRSRAIRYCCDFIEEHLGETISLSDLASQVGYADYYLSHKFKEETGRSINEYIREAKIARARSLLAHSDMSIQDISDSLGFSSRNFFAVTFKEVTGIPPAAYRKQHQS